jgi:drug/metabolite transporter (DMT)-like permease
MSDRAITRAAGLSRVPSPLIPEHSRRRATLWLLAATSLWGVSFPLGKALVLAQRQLLPEASSWFLASATLACRFSLAALVLAWFARSTVRTITRLEVTQGIGLGVFAGCGMLFQLDGIQYTSASVSAFLTSCYCIIIPIIVAWQRRKLPPLLVLGSCALVVAGMALLAGLDWHKLRLGRGEAETVLCSCFFAAQIFWLERPAFARNRTMHATLIMCASLALVALPVLLIETRSVGDIGRAFAGSPAIVAFLLSLTLLCTLATFTLMNHWQRFLEATEAGLIYCAEPVFASIFALFLPAWLATYSGSAYANETLTARLLTGGCLITAANICIQMRPRAVTPVR